MKKKQRPFAYPLIAALLTLPSGVYADAAPDIVGVEQTVGEPMAKALKALEKSTGYRIRFAYDDVKDFKAQAKPDTKDIRKALGQVIGNLPLQFSIEGRFVEILPASKPQSKQTAASQGTLQVVGKVVDAQGEYLPGVSIKVPSINLVIVTNSNGDFALQLPKGRTTKVDFSFIGMKDQSRLPR